MNYLSSPHLCNSVGGSVAARIGCPEVFIASGSVVVARRRYSSGPRFTSLKAKAIIARHATESALITQK